MRESEVKAAMLKIINGTAARTSFQDSQSYVTFLFSGWRIGLVSEGYWGYLLSSMHGSGTDLEGRPTEV